MPAPAPTPARGLLPLALPRTEQGVLRASVAVTVVLAGVGILFGVLSGSAAIAFDGIFSLADASMTLLSLVVSRLIADYARGTSRLARRFSFGFWHLEPMVLALNGTLLTGVIGYALVDAAGSLLRGGRPLAFGTAIVYAVVVVAACLAMAILGRRANRTIGSDFVALDARGWLISGGITTALLVAFVTGALLQGTAHADLAPYVDPIALMIVCAVVLPIPVGTVRRALAEVLLVTPAALQTHVETVAAGIVAREGFLGFRAYVAKVGRARQIELYFIAPDDLPARRLGDWDALRDEIGVAIGDEGPDRWLTIVFTADRTWAD